AQIIDETSMNADIVCPDHHYLEAWGDANPKAGVYTLQQPTINPIFAQPRHEGTRQFQDSLLKWSGAQTDYHTFLQNFWNTNIFPSQTKIADFRTFWAQALHDGALITGNTAEVAPATAGAEQGGGSPDFN